MAAAHPISAHPPAAYTPLRLLQRHSRTRAEVSLVSTPHGPAVLKDFAPCNALFRFFFAPGFVRREARAYRALGEACPTKPWRSGVPGIPRLLGRPTETSLLVQYIAGHRPSRAPHGLLRPDFFDRLTATVHAVHARGWVLIDLRDANLLVDETGAPWLIDLTTASLLVAHPWLRWWVGRFLVEDRRAIALLKQRLLPAALTPADRALIAHADWYTKTDRALGALLRPLFEGLFGWVR